MPYQRPLSIKRKTLLCVQIHKLVIQRKRLWEEGFSFGFSNAVFAGQGSFIQQETQQLRLRRTLSFLIFPFPYAQKKGAGISPAP